MKPAGALRKGNYKLIEWYGPDACGKKTQTALYNLSTDIGETQNLTEAFPDKTRELLQYLEEWRSKIGAQMPVKNPDFQLATGTCDQ
jgi:arylsulfatase A